MIRPSQSMTTELLESEDRLIESLESLINNGGSVSNQEYSTICKIQEKLEALTLRFHDSRYCILMSQVPDDIWSRVFRYLKKEIAFWRPLRLVSRQWDHCVRQITHIEIYNYSDKATKGMPVFKNLLSANIYCDKAGGSFDATLFTSLRKLRLNLGVNTPLCSRFSLLTNLTKLQAVKWSDMHLGSLSLHQKSKLISLQCTGVRRSDTLKQFTNLERLNILDNSSLNDIQSLSRLTCLKVLAQDLRHMSYTGYAIVSIMGEAWYYGKVSGGVLLMDERARILQNHPFTKHGQVVWNWVAPKNYCREVTPESHPETGMRFILRSSHRASVLLKDSPYTKEFISL